MAVAPEPQQQAVKDAHNTDRYQNGSQPQLLLAPPPPQKQMTHEQGQGEDEPPDGPSQPENHPQHPDSQAHAVSSHEEKDGPCLELWHFILRSMFTPQTNQEWLWFFLLWLGMLGLLVFFVVWAFPRIVDAAYDPAVSAIDSALTRVQIGVVVSSAVMILPLTIILAKEPFVWLAATLFSFPEAFAMVEAGLIPGMAIPFFLSKYWLRRPVLRFLERYKYTKAVLYGVRKAGPFFTSLILRLGPVPDPITNYMMGIPPDHHTQWFFLKYMAGSIIGTLPGIVLGVIFGRNIKGLAAMLQGEKVPASQMAYNLVSLFAALALVVGGYIYARRAFRELEIQAAAEEALSNPVIETVHPADPHTPPPYTTLTTPEATYIIIQSVPLTGPHPHAQTMQNGHMGPTTQVTGSATGLQGDGKDSAPIVGPALAMHASKSSTAHDNADVKDVRTEPVWAPLQQDVPTGRDSDGTLDHVGVTVAQDAQAPQREVAVGGSERGTSQGPREGAQPCLVSHSSASGGQGAGHSKRGEGEEGVSHSDVEQRCSQGRVENEDRTPGCEMSGVSMPPELVARGLQQPALLPGT